MSTSDGTAVVFDAASPDKSEGEGPMAAQPRSNAFHSQSSVPRINDHQKFLSRRNRRRRMTS